jgi:ammonium transporter, Amt family
MDTGDTAWLLASSALVLLMTPGLAFFYGGMTRAKSVLNMLMMNFAAIAVVSILWVLYGYSLSFTTDIGGGLLGGFSALGLDGQLQIPAWDGATVPATVFAAFQLMFAIITVALISGAIADRVKFSAWMVFIVLWSTVVYFPVAHWVFFFDGGNGGWIADRLKALDFAGGTAVHINAGAAGLALALIIGKRVGWRKEPMRPHNLPLVLLGAGLLWFGWFGFNAGSAVAANGTAGVAFINTQVATAAAVLGWLLVEKIRDGKPTTLGAASGAVAGLVAITPACASVNPIGAIVVGVAAGILCGMAISIKNKYNFDDSLDVVGVHLVGGLVGCLLIGFLATQTAPADVNGLFFGGGFDQLWRQTVAAVAVGAYSFIVTGIIGLVISKVMGWRISEEAETEGIDYAEHAETAYDFTSIGVSTRRIIGSSERGPEVEAVPEPVAEAEDAEASEKSEEKEGSPAR